MLKLACIHSFSQTAPLPPSPVPPNASRITAAMRKRSVWPPESLQNTSPVMPPEQVLYSLALEIHSAEPVSPDLESSAVPGIPIEVFSAEVLAAALVGKNITATVELTGDTRAVQWWISKVQLLP